MSASAVRAGRAFVEIFAKDNLSKELDRIGGKLKSFGASITRIGAATAAAGAAAIAPLIGMGLAFAKSGDELTKASDRTGVAVDQIASLKYAAEQSGSSLDDLQGSLLRMQKVIAAAASGNKAAVESLNQLGLSLEQLQGLSPDEQFRLIAESISKVGEAAQVDGLARVKVAIEQAANTSDKARASLDAAGLSLSELGQASPDDLFSKLAESAVGGGDAAKTAIESLGISLTELQGLSSGEQIQKLTAALGGLSRSAGSNGLGELKEALSRIAKESDDAASSLGAVGLSAADLGSIEPETLFKRLAESATSGGKASQEVLSRIGVSFSKLEGLSSDEQIRQIADAVSRVEDPAKRAASAIAIFGKGGAASLLPLLKGGADGLRELEERFRKLGLEVSKADTDAATKFGDTLDDLRKQFGQVVFQIGAAVANALQPFADTAISTMATVIRWVKENRGLVISVLAVGAGLVAAGTALAGFGLVVSAIGAGIAAIVPILAGVGAAVAALFSPIGILAASVAGAAAYFLYFTETGQYMVSLLADKFGELKETALKAFGGIGDALASGNISLAAEILWVSLKLLWTQGTQSLMNTWYEFKAAFVTVASSAFYGVLNIWENVQSGLAKGMISSVAFLGNLWDGFVNTFTSLWQGAVALISKGLNLIRGVFDETFDADAANKAINQQVENNKQARDAADLARETERQQEEKDAIAQIESDRKSAIDTNNAADKSAKSAADQKANDEINALQLEREQLQQKLDALTKAASDGREQKESADAAGGGKKPGKPTRPVEPKLPEPPDPAKIKQVAESAGVFSSANVASILNIGGPNLAKEQLAEAKKQTEALEDISEKLAEDDSFTVV